MTANNLQIMLEVTENSADVPNESKISCWAQAAYQRSVPAAVSIKLVTEAESSELNKQYRQQDKATNVLSFPLDAPMDDSGVLLGDLAICSQVVQREAADQDKSIDAHWAHMIVHGMLHLQGYDHIEDSEATSMERLETEILQGLGFADPYGN